MVDDLTRLARIAHADAWEAEGLLRRGYGGGAARVRGARLMASGIAAAKWNNADVIDEEPDVEAMASWYAALDVPWGVRVPLEIELELGAPVLVKRCVALRRAEFADRDASTGDVRVRRAAVDEAGSYAGLDLEIFGGDIAASRAWIEPEFAAPSVAHWIASLGGSDVGIATVIQTDADAGPAAYLTGLGVVPNGPRDVILNALIVTGARHAFSAEADLVHANPTDDPEAAVFRALGAIEVPGLSVRVVRG